MKKAFKNFVTITMLLLCVIGPHTAHALTIANATESVDVISKIKFKSIERVNLAHVTSSPSSSNTDLNSKHKLVIENENEEYEDTSSKKFIDNLNDVNKLLYFQCSLTSIHLKKSLRLCKDFSIFKGYNPKLYKLFEVYRI